MSNYRPWIGSNFSILVRRGVPTGETRGKDDKNKIPNDPEGRRT